MTMQIRPYHVDDLTQTKALEARVKPYRPEDQAEVEAMFERAWRAEQERDERWISGDAQPPMPPLEAAEATYLAFWVAVVSSPQTLNQVVGMVGVYRGGTALEMSPTLPLAQDWLSRNDVAELRRLRVAPELWRQGIGLCLTQTVIDWSRRHGFHTLIVNTTAAQLPALNLYRKLGFQEVGRSFVDEFELVWFELALQPANP